MAAKLMSLRMAPDDEVEEMMALLAEHHIDCYYTPEGSFGISAAALWLHDESDLKDAQSLLKNYQTERAEKATTHYKSELQHGTQTTLWHKFSTQPLVFILSILGVVFFAYVLFVPILDLMRK